MYFLPPPNDKKEQIHTFWPDRTNRVPSDLVDMLRAKKGSVRDDGEAISAFDEYLDSGVLFKMHADEANKILDAGGRPIPHQEGAGQNTSAPEMKDIGATAKEQAVLDSIPQPTTHTLEVDGEAKAPQLPGA